MAKIEGAKVRRRKGAPAPKTNKPEVVKSIVGNKPGVVKRLCGVLFGPPKTGKTTAACSGTNVLLIMFDPDGDQTETLAGREDITVVKPKSGKEVTDIVKALHTTDAGRFTWVVVDSLTFLFQLLGGKEINKVYAENKDVRRAYGRAGAAVSQIVHDLVLLEDVNIIFTAHLTKEKDNDDSVGVETILGESEVKVAVTPMVWTILSGAVSFIGRTYKETVFEKEGKKRNKRTRFAVSFNDGDRSPAGSRLTMDGEYEITDHLLKDLATELIQGGST